MRKFVDIANTMGEDAPVAASTSEGTPDAVLREYGRWAIMVERRAFGGYFNEALQLVRQRRCYSMTDLAARFGRTSAWATRLKECALRQGLFTLEEWAMSFRRRRDGKGRPPSGLNGMSLQERSDLLGLPP